MTKKKTLLLSALSNEDKASELADEEFVQDLEQDKKSEYIIQLLRKRIERKDEEIKDIQQDRSQRKEFADKLFDLMCWYLVGVYLLILMNGISTMNFHISDDIILALLGTTAVEIIGTFAIVARYLFSKNNKTS